MDSENLVKFKDALTAACDQHLAAGGKIVRGSFFATEGCCPIGCLIGENNPLTIITLNKKLGFFVSEEEMWSFIIGFDGRSASDITGGFQELFQLGQELRTKYIKE